MMFTTIDKALAGFVMGGAWLINHFFGVDLGLDPETVGIVIAGLTPLLVWLVPNKEPAA